MQACREACNEEVPVLVDVISGIGKVHENLTRILGICAGVDGFEDEDLFLWLEVTPLLTDPNIGILIGKADCFLLVNVALFNQVFPV